MLAAVGGATFQEVSFPRSRKQNWQRRALPDAIVVKDGVELTMRD